MQKPFLLSINLLLLATIPPDSILRADSLWGDQVRLAAYSDRKAVAVGDIITVVVQESNVTTKEANTKTSKDSSLDASISSFLFSPGASKFLTKGGQLPAMKMSSSDAFTGGGAVKKSDSINARFAVRVVDVLPNENLLIEGSRQTSFSGETQTVRLRGTVRRADVTPANTVLSYQLADLQLKYGNSGSVSDSQSKGWFGKIWGKVTPF